MKPTWSFYAGSFKQGIKLPECRLTGVFRTLLDRGTCYRRLYYLYPRWIFHCDAIPTTSSTIMDNRCVRIPFLRLWRVQRVASLCIMIPWSCHFQYHYNIQTDSKVLFSVEPPWPCFSEGNINTLKFWKYTCNTRVGQYNCTAYIMTVEKRISSFKKISLCDWALVPQAIY